MSLIYMTIYIVREISRHMLKKLEIYIENNPIKLERKNETTIRTKKTTKKPKKEKGKEPKKSRENQRRSDKNKRNRCKNSEIPIKKTR